VLRLQLYREAQASELVDQALGARLWIQALEVVFAEFVVGLATRNDMVDDHEQRMRQRHNRFLVPTPGSNTSVASGQSRVFGVGGGLRGLDQQRSEPRVALAGAATALPSCALVVSRRQACPGGERCGGGEARHIRADFGDHDLCAGLPTSCATRKQTSSCKTTRSH
jgi:hypothetical protein